MDFNNQAQSVQEGMKAMACYMEELLTQRYNMEILILDRKRQEEEIERLKEENNNLEQVNAAVKDVCTIMTSNVSGKGKKESEDKVDELIEDKRRIEELVRDKEYRKERYEEALESKTYYKEKNRGLENEIKNLNKQIDEEGKMMGKMMGEERIKSRERIKSLEEECKKLDIRSMNLAKHL